MAIVDLVRFDGLGSVDWLIYKHPVESLSTGTQLIVQEGQAAIFVKDGAVCDTFLPGKYTLSTQNLPILQEVVKTTFGGRTPFSAEIYFVNTVVRLDIKWGTDSPIQLVDPKYNIKLRVRAYGIMGLKVTDPTALFKGLIGAMRKSDVVRYKKVYTFYRGLLVAKVKSAISEDIITNKISALDMPARIESLSKEIKEKISPAFAAHGLTLASFYINSINIPEEDLAPLSKILNDNAAFKIMGEKQYATKRTLDVYQSAADNKGGLAGTMAAGSVGIGTGMAMAGAMGQGLAMGAQNFKPLVHAEADKECLSCHKRIPINAKFCPECGAKCPDMTCECGAVLPPGTKFCPQCGKKVG